MCKVSSSVALALSLGVFLVPAHADARQPKPGRTSAGPEVMPFPALLTSFGGGSFSNERLGVLGGDVLAGAGLILGDDHTFVLMPTIGWSGWRTTDKPSRLRANTFTGRLDLGYMNFDYHQGISVFGGGRVGTGRGPVPDLDATQLYGAMFGVAYWPAALVGLEFQSNYTNYLGEWQTDLRFTVTFNAVFVLLPLISWIGMAS